MKRRHAEVQAAASVNAIISFDLSAAAAYFERLGQTSVATSLRERAADLLAETARLQGLLDEVLPVLSHSSRFPGVRATEHVRGSGLTPPSGGCASADGPGSKNPKP
ncbi:hypothetical protein [Methylobacterium nigriterrae]|uniref:hypothetical protein n=1 Tax=Methylobacterium nigriterrae TaxID=3127512 RepID=UPI003013BD9F